MSDVQRINEELYQVTEDYKELLEKYFNINKEFEKLKKDYDELQEKYNNAEEEFSASAMCCYRKNEKILNLEEQIFILKNENNIYKNELYKKLKEDILEEVKKIISK